MSPKNEARCILAIYPLLVLLTVLVLLLVGCTSPSKSKLGVTEGTPPFAAYYGEGYSVHSPQGTWPVHGVVDGGGADLLGGQAIAQLGLALPDKLFLQSPSDVTGENWNITVDGEGGVVLELGTITISKSEPILATGELTATIQETLAGLGAEAQASIRAQAEQFAETIRSVAPTLADAIIRAFVPVP